MTQLTQDQLDGRTIIGTDGDKIGKIQDVYYDDATGQAEWATVKTGKFGSKQAFVPLSAAAGDGDDITVPFDKDTVKNSPHYDTENGELDTEQEAELFSYYKIPFEGQTVTAAGPPETGDVADTRSDGTMTRSEEQLHVGTRTVETGTVRLRKRIVTENVTKTVPVTHEEVVVEREPITDATRADAKRGQDLSEDEAVVTLHADEAVATKETVPVEQVSLGTHEVAGEDTVSEDVRKEQIDVDNEK